jgi:hypothetical protein
MARFLKNVVIIIKGSLQLFACGKVQCIAVPVPDAGIVSLQATSGRICEYLVALGKYGLVNNNCEGYGAC